MIKKAYLSLTPYYSKEFYGVFYIAKAKRPRGEILGTMLFGIGTIKEIKHWGFIIPSIKVNINVL